MLNIMSVLMALFIVSALSIDAFVSCFAYGANKIKIPFVSAISINIICSAILAVSLFLGKLIHPFLPETFTAAISFILLFLLGITRLFDGVAKAIIKKYTQFHKEIGFKICSLKFILNIYASPENADIDNSRILSIKESVYLACALSLDAVGVGFGIGIDGTNPLLIIMLSLVINMIAVGLGSKLGNSIAAKTTLDLAWLSGAVLVALAVFRLFY